MPPAPTSPSTSDLAQVELETEQRVTDGVGRHLRPGAETHLLQPGRAGAVERFERSRRDVLDRLGIELGEHAGRVEGDGPGRRAGARGPTAPTISMATRISGIARMVARSHLTGT